MDVTAAWPDEARVHAVVAAFSAAVHELDALSVSTHALVDDGSKLAPGAPVPGLAEIGVLSTLAELVKLELDTGRHMLERLVRLRDDAVYMQRGV